MIKVVSDIIDSQNTHMHTHKANEREAEERLCQEKESDNGQKDFGFRCSERCISLVLHRVGWNFGCLGIADQECGWELMRFRKCHGHDIHFENERQIPFQDQLRNSELRE